MSKVQLPEAVAEKEVLATEYNTLLTTRAQLVEKYDNEMRATAGTEEYVKVIKERNSKVSNGIDVRLNEIQNHIRTINKLIEDAKPKVVVTEEKEDKKKKGKKGKKEEIEDEYEEDEEE